MLKRVLGWYKAIVYVVSIRDATIQLAHGSIDISVFGSVLMAWHIRVFFVILCLGNRNSKRLRKIAILIAILFLYFT